MRNLYLLPALLCLPLAAADVKIPDEIANLLVGDWEGSFNYPPESEEKIKNVKLLFTFKRGDDGKITGRCKEQNTFADPSKKWIGADVTELSVDSRGTIIFRLVYDGNAGATHTIFYGGRAEPNGNIKGTWWIPGDWSHTFEIRKKPAP